MSKWTTYEHLHLDRVATPWLIRRFIDPQAEFIFLPWGQADQAPADAVSFGFPGSTIGGHDEEGTAFEKTITRYDLDDPALPFMGRIIGAGVRHALKQPPRPGQTDEEAAIGLTLDQLGFGMGVVHDDDDNLAASMSLYDALYAYCEFQTLSEEIKAQVPRTPNERTAFLREHLRQFGD
jgi:hypothetical protein